MLHLAAGVPVSEVIRLGGFKITAELFVKHMAIFCAKSLDHHDSDISMTREQILEETCTHAPEGQYCMQCARKNILSMLPSATHDDKDGGHNDKKSVDAEITGQKMKNSSLLATKFATAKAKLPRRVLKMF